MKDFLKKLIATKEARAKELREAVKNSTDINEVRSLGEVLESILAELSDAKAQLEAVEADEAKAAEDVKDSADEGRSANIKMEGRGINPMGILGFDVSATHVDNTVKETEARAQQFANTNKMTIGNTEARSVLVSGGKIATPTEVGGINDAFNKVSSIVDQVNVEDCTGMGSYKVAYEVDGLTAAEVAEGSVISDGDMTFAYATITPKNVSVLAYISAQVQKQSPLQYEAKVRNSALNALRAKGSEIVVDAILNSEITEKTTIDALDEKTLRKVALSYGGNENVMQGATLYLSKETLIALGDVRGSDKKAVYKITPNTQNPNTGIIEDGGLAVAYTLNSKLTNKMIYGQAQNATLGLFGDYEIKVSEDFAFNKNMLAVRGTVDLGAAVCFNKGFIVATIGA